MKQQLRLKHSLALKHAFGSPKPSAARNQLFGVNLSGPEFAPWNGQTFPTRANFAYLASVGVGFARLPIAWESAQPVLGAALDATYMGKVYTALRDANDYGIGLIVEAHNFGAYVDQAQWTTTVGYAGNAGVAGTGVNFMGDAVLTTAQYTDFWTRLMTGLTGRKGLIGVGAMNEPAAGIVRTNIVTTPNYPTGSNWFITNAAVLTKLADGTNPLGATYGPAWSGTSGSGFGSVAFPVTFANVAHVLSIYAKVSSGTNANFYLQIQGTNSTAKTLTTSWQRFEFTRTPAAGASNIQFGLLGEATPGVVFQFANVQLELGAVATAYVPNPWVPYAQVAIDAIAAVDAAIPIYLSGYNFSQAASWLANNYELAKVTGANPKVYEAHQYFDGAQGVGGGGAYSGTFTSYSITTTTGAEAIAEYLAWCVSKGVTGYLGEFGVPNSVADNNAQWLPTQVLFEQALLAARVRGTTWFFRSNGVQPGNILGITTNADPRLLQMLAVR